MTFSCFTKVALIKSLTLWTIIFSQILKGKEVLPRLYPSQFVEPSLLAFVRTAFKDVHDRWGCKHEMVPISHSHCPCSLSHIVIRYKNVVVMFKFISWCRLTHMRINSNDIPIYLEPHLHVLLSRKTSFCACNKAPNSKAVTLTCCAANFMFTHNSIWSRLLPIRQSSLPNIFVRRRAGLFEPPSGASSLTLRILRKNSGGLFTKS